MKREPAMRGIARKAAIRSCGVQIAV